jgi:D-psicose/D-tagatose/L-ribulose 3-epimerase
VSGDASAGRDLYFSFFMFTTDLRPDDHDYRRVIVRHIETLTSHGYTGFDVPIAPPRTPDPVSDIEGYARLRDALDGAGLEHVPLSANVGATRRYDPTSPYREQRQAALVYLKSRVDITAALRGGIMAGPMIFPYNVFPLSDAGDPIWSDALQEWAAERYAFAQPILDELGDYAGERGVTLAIEPVDHWETPVPNLVGEVLDFLAGVASRQVGVCIDSAHVALGGEGPAAFAQQVERAGERRRIHSVHISPPDRGALHDSWIPWRQFLEPVLRYYEAPLLIEIFNAVPALSTSLRLSRRRFWVPGEDPPVAGVPDAYTIAARAAETVREQLSAMLSAPAGARREWV